jgi:hypothetical protein
VCGLAGTARGQADAASCAHLAEAFERRQHLCLAFVPSHLTFRVASLTATMPAFSGPLPRMFRLILVLGESSVSLGIAAEAVARLQRLAEEKTAAFTATSLRDRELIQYLAGKAKSRVDAARAYLHQMRATAYEAATVGLLTMEANADLQLALAYSTELCAESVRLVHEAVGATGVRNEAGFERLFRDAHTLTQHANHSSTRYATVAKLLFGHDNDWIALASDHPKAGALPRSSSPENASARSRQSNSQFRPLGLPLDSVCCLWWSACGPAAVSVRKHPTKQTQHRALAPADFRTPALDRSHAFDEATDDGEEEIGRTGSDKQALQPGHGAFILVPHDRHRSRLTHGIQLHFHRRSPQRGQGGTPVTSSSSRAATEGKHFRKPGWASPRVSEYRVRVSRRHVPATAGYTFSHRSR